MAINERPPILYDIDMKRIAYLERATRIGYKKVLNGLWTAKFELPADDPKTTLCQPMRYVEIYDGPQVGLFRITNKTITRQDSGNLIAYYLEHVLATLMDSLLYRYHQIGNIGVFTTEVLSYILSKQDQPRWQLGQVEFDRQFEYSWENENLLAALFSVPKPFDQDYQWTWNTASQPWTLNLVEASNQEGQEIAAGRNLKSLTFTEEVNHLTTRLYPLGQGEGINQLGIETVNPTGLPYIDAETIGTYGLITRVWADRRYESPETLYAAAVEMLKNLSQGRVAVSIAAADLAKYTRVESDQIEIGLPLRIKDIELGILYNSRVMEIEKPDIYGEPDAINITIANKPQDIAGTIADLANRTRINEVYSQGATSIDSHQVVDNCDTTNPVKIKFHIPTEAVFINKVLLNYETEAFRAYSKGNQDGGAGVQTSSSGGASTTTSSSGGGTSTTTSSGGGQTSSSSGSHSHSVSGQTASLSGSHSHAVYGAGVSTLSNTSTGTYHTHPIGSSSRLIGGTNAGGSHSHSVTGTTSSTTGSHSHTVSNHTHSVSISAHTHSVSTPSHTHNVTIPAHSHDITYGIYNGPTPTAVTVKVDGTTIPGLGLSETEVNITQDLSKTAGGMIERGWHEVTITPNSLGRVHAAIHIQQFLQSKGDIRG